ncbi:MAG: type II secretion system protein [Thiotrichales bacterium]|nr:type II secretion system protein [Thiotrichales bacterium]
MRLKSLGFSLIEVTLFLIALSLLSVWVLNAWQLESALKAPRQERFQQLKITEALQSFLQINLFLPCPDVDGDGREDRRSLGGVAVCQAREGGLPYLNLAAPARDAWGNPYYYRVHQRAQEQAYITQICETASVFGRSGARGLQDLWLCSSNNQFYCADHAGSSTCDSVCDQSCTNLIDPRPTPFIHVNPLHLAPYFHLNTPPFGTRVGALNLQISDASGQRVEEGVVALVLSWGANGAQVNRQQCQSLLETELENCDGDRDFMFAPTGENQDYLQWVTVHQAKLALIKRQAFD